MPGPDPAVAAVRGAVRSAVADLAPGARVLVACSGGADSLALAAATAFVATRQGLCAGAVVVDHGWSPDSAQVARRAARTCRDLGLDPVDVVAVDTRSAPGQGGAEAVARAARYAALGAVATRNDAVALLLGHTLDDQAETVLLGLARGSGARSLAGMPRHRGLLRRPLLGLTRRTTATACAALGLTPWLDPANEDPAYTRSRLRAALADVRALLGEALGPGLDAALARTADLLREDADVLEAAAQDLLDRARVAPGPHPASSDPANGLDVAVLVTAPDAVRRRALLVAIRAAGSPPGAVGRQHVLAVDALLVAWHGQQPIDLPGRVRAGRSCGTLWLKGPGARAQPEAGAQLTPQPTLGE